jgi:DNA/RNA endonuclease G (NUC1)
VDVDEGIVYHVIGDYITRRNDKRTKALSVSMNTNRVRVPADFWISRKIVYLRQETGRIELKVCRDPEDEKAIVFVMRFVTARDERVVYECNCATLHQLRSCFRKMTSALLTHVPRLASARLHKESVINFCGIQALWNLYEAGQELHQDTADVARTLKRVKRSEQEEEHD